MDIHYILKKGEILPHIESFMVLRQDKPCPPAIFKTLYHKILVDVSQNPKLRAFHFPFKTCPINVTMDILSEE